ncbi:MAG: acyl-CoA thioesterase [Lachnospiraceae bacterium]|nr:acyl-CoA thioesterase [Lachnospiraceae bacterium]
MEPYRHTVCYYETDRMGITHHSNYIRWMEEARVDYLAKLGWGYEKLEAAGIVSPVTSVTCRYRHSTTFPDDVFITVSVEEFRGVRLKLSYRMADRDGKCVCEAGSEHCFLDRAGRPVRLDRVLPDFFRVLTEQAGAAGN